MRVHKAGILHHDLKPENILLPESGTGPKVVDFGVAKLSTNTTDGGTMTNSGTIVGRPADMAPEQLRGGSGRSGPGVQPGRDDV